MERLPNSQSIALWIVGSFWALAILAYALGASREWILPLFMFGLLVGVGEWVIRERPD